MFARIKTLFLDTRVLLALILLLGFTIRIWGLGSAEVFHDEGLYSFRSIGYIDYIQNEDQSTPIQWFKDLYQMPWWTKLSFHDAPPLYFIISHIFFNLFGHSLFVARLPSFVAGMFAIWLMFLIGRQLFTGLNSKGSDPHLGVRPLSSELAGLLAALFLSINHIHIWISRTSIIESLLLTMMLANIYFFLRFINFGSRTPTWESDSQANWILFGATFGLMLLTKYNGIVLAPVYFFYLLLFHRDYFKKWQLYASALLAIVIFSPVLIYNYYLYQTVHHFDLQLSYFFRQVTPEWRASLGKIQDSISYAMLGNPFSAVKLFVLNLLAMYSKTFLLVSVASICSILFFWRKSSKEEKKSYVFIISGIIFVTILLYKIGVAYRFLSLYLPFSVLLIVAFILLLKQYINLNKIIFPVAVIIFCLSEIWFSIGGIFIEFPRLGVVDLDKYLQEELGKNRSLSLIKSPNTHLNAVIQKYYDKLPKGDVPNLIVYDDNIDFSPKLWLFARRLYYEGVPTITVGQFNSMLRASGPEYFNKYKIYFVRANENSVMINARLFYSPDAKNLEDFLHKEFSLNPIKTIYGFQPSDKGMQQIPIFYVYKILF